MLPVSSCSQKASGNKAPKKNTSIVVAPTPNVVPVSSLKPNQQGITIIVRVLRKWDVCFKNNEKPVAWEMVFVDNEGSKILGRMEFAYKYKFGNMLKEGYVVSLSDFKLVPANGQYRPTSHECKLNLGFHSIVEELPPTEVSLPPIQFTPPEYCLRKDFNKDYLVDVVGLYIRNTDPTTFESQGSKETRMTVDLQTEGVPFTVTLFGDYALEMKQFVDSGNAPGAVIALLFCKVNKWPGGTSIQTIQCTSRLMINPDIPEVAFVRESSQPLTVTPLGSKVSFQRLSDEEAFLMLEQKYSVNDIRELIEIEEFVTVATINSIVEGLPWWYWACREDNFKCTKEEEAPGLYYCPKCDKHVRAVVRKLILRLSIHDETDCIVVTLFDNIVKMLTGKTAEDVYQAWKQDPVKPLYPTELNNLIGREAIWRIVVSNREGYNYCRAYKATRASFAEVLIKKYNERWSSQGAIEGSSHGLLLIEDAPSGDAAGMKDEKGPHMSQDVVDEFQESASRSTSVLESVSAVDLTKDTEEAYPIKRKLDRTVTSAPMVPVKNVKVEK